MDAVLRFLGAALVIFGGGYVVGMVAFLTFGLRGGLEAIGPAIAAFACAALTWAMLWLWVFL